MREAMRPPLSCSGVENAAANRAAANHSEIYLLLHIWAAKIAGKLARGQFNSRLN